MFSCVMPASTSTPSFYISAIAAHSIRIKVIKRLLKGEFLIGSLYTKILKKVIKG